ncbi:FMN-binding protein [Shewanella atlantica]|uniref:4Fe-4S binding protein n=1 Tax=Shewanella atlantica TaxID=271099 RepID=A0A3S0IGT8_9GAMM|nr:4Fe-4S binding protein [Shewanella atlantica]RTR33636.1 4Fe-4S binding protein [Shewanella atlantica]
MYSKKRIDFWKKVASLVSVSLLLLAWYCGSIRISDNQSDMVDQLLINGELLTQIHPRLYQGTSANELSPVEFIGLGSGIGYGGITEVAVTVSSQGDIQRVAVLSSKDTSSYLDKVLQSNLMEKILGENIKVSLEIDGVSGATVSTNALTDAIKQAADSVRVQVFGFSMLENEEPVSHFRWLDLMAIAMFTMAILVNKTRHRKKSMFNWAILLSSMCVFGFYSSSLFSSSTMGILISGAWFSGLGNYTSLILLSLVILYIIVSNRNVYCTSLCPFGATQECLAKLGNAKTTSLTNFFFEWFPRGLLLTTLCLGLYFRNPASFSYEPFGIMFGMIGSIYLFVLTVLAIVTSLVVKRPWCRTLCPMNPMTDFIRFNRQWFKSILNKQRAKREIMEANQMADVAVKSNEVSK